MMRGYTSEGNFVDGFKFPSGNTNFGIIERVEGSWTNVVGLPMEETAAALARAGVVAAGK